MSQRNALEPTSPPHPAEKNHPETHGDKPTTLIYTELGLT